MIALAGALLVVACGDDDAGIDAAPRIDAFRPDAALPADGPDAEPRDGGELDGAELPDGTPDAAPPDAVIPDAVVETANPPIVAVVSPAQAEVVTLGTVELECEARPNATTLVPVNAVRFEIVSDTYFGSLDATDEGSDRWKAQARIDMLPNGPFLVRCNAFAEDEIGTDTNDAYVDLGPKITLRRPTTGAAVHGTVNIEFDVEPWPTGKPGDDAAAAVPDGNVFVEIGGKEIPHGRFTRTGATWTADLETGDSTLFVPPLNGGHMLHIAATNSRAPAGVTRDVRADFVVDNTGPSISIDEPVLGQLIGGIVTVTATIVDDNGVNTNTVKAVFGMGSIEIVEFDLEYFGGDVFVGVYDTAELRQIVEAQWPGLQLVFPTLSVRARDLPGNLSTVGDTYAMDYTPPVADLTPPMIREVVNHCPSEPFDPVGDDSTNDLQQVYQLSEMRVWVEDLSNTGTTGSEVLIPKAGTDPASVQLFVLGEAGSLTRAAGDALVVDVDGDGRCDEINPSLVPTTIPTADEDVLVVNLAPAAAAGSAWFTSEYTDGACVTKDPPPAPPRPVCEESSTLTRIIPGDDEPAIWGIPPVAGDWCLGYPFDYVANAIPDGWACAAVRAVDGLGNVGVSDPIRVCFDYTGVGCAGTPPDCVGAYDRYDLVTPTDPAASCDSSDWDWVEYIITG